MPSIIFANRYIFPSTDDIGVDNGNGSGSGNDNGDINDGSGCASRSAVGFGVGVGVSRQSSVGRPYAKKGNWFVVLNGFNDIPAQFVLPWVRIDVVRCICNVNEGQLMCCWSREVVACHGCLMCYDTCCHDV
jgi:hypothetical protein